MAIAFAVTGMSRAPTLVTDIQGGYFDRLCMTPIRRMALLLGLMVADVAVIVALCIPVLAIGFGVGVRFATGFAGRHGLRRVLRPVGSGLHRIPLRRGPEDGKSGRRQRLLRGLLPAVLPQRRRRAQGVLTGWFSTIATYNPVTYLLGALRSLIVGGWQVRSFMEGLAAVGGLGLVSIALALAALKARIRMGE